MKKKTLWKVLVVLMVLILSVGIFAACGDKDKDDSGKQPVNPGGQTDNPSGSGDATQTKATEKEKQATFFDTMFQSADLLGGSPVDLSEGHDLALNVGLTLEISIVEADGKLNTLPVTITASGLIDRTNVTRLADKEDAKGAWVKVGENLVVYDKDNVAHNDLKRYNKVYSLDSDNKTALDICIKTAGVESLHIYYDVEATEEDSARGILYITLAGNKFKMDLNKSAAADNGFTTKIEDVVYNFVENGLLTNKTLNSVISSFGESFDLNSLLSGVITDLLGSKLKDKNLADYLLSSQADGGVGDKPLFGSLTISSLVTKLFGNATNVRNYLGTTIDVNAILKQVSSMLFDNIKWWVSNNGNWKDASANYDALIKSNLKQAIKAEATLGGTVGGLVKGATFLEGNSYLKLGFTKEAGSNNIGKMDSFYIDVYVDSINDSKEAIKLALSVDELAFGQTAEAVEFTGMTEDEKATYGDFSFEAGAKLTVSDEILSAVFHRSSDVAESTGFDTNTDNDYEIVIGKNNGGTSFVSADGRTVNIPKNFNISIKGVLDFTSPADTKMVLNVIAEDYNGTTDFTVATVQIYPATDNKTLVADAKIYDKDLVPYIMNLIAYVSNISDDNPGNNLAGFKKYNGEWGWWHEGYELLANVDDGFTAKVKDENTVGVYYSKNGATYTKIADVTAIENGTTIYKLNDNMAVLEDYSDYVPAREGGYYGDAILYKKVGTEYAVAEANYAGTLYVAQAKYVSAGTKDTVTELYNSKGMISLFASDALNKFFETGEIKVTGINLYNLIFNDSNVAKVFIDEYHYYGGKGYEQASATQVESGGEFRWIQGLISSDKNFGALSIVSKLISYSSSTGTLTIGGENILDTLFGAAGIFEHTNKADIPTSLYSVLGYLTDKGNTDIISAWKNLESDMKDLSERGIWFGDYTPVLRLDRGASSISDGEKLYTEWKTASSERKAVIADELLEIGYQLVPVSVYGNDGKTVNVSAATTDVVLYPSVLYVNEISDWALNYMGASESDAAAYKARINDCGFDVTIISATQYKAGEIGYFTRTKDSTKYYCRVTSKSVALLEEEWLKAEQDGEDSTVISNLKLSLFRRGMAARKYQNADDEWVYYTEKVFIDEVMLQQADATIQLYTEKDGDVITEAGIKIDIGIWEETATLDLYMKFMPDGLTKTSLGTFGNLLTAGDYEEFRIQIVK